MTLLKIPVCGIIISKKKNQIRTAFETKFTIMLKYTEAKILSYANVHTSGRLDCSKIYKPNSLFRLPTKFSK